MPKIRLNLLENRIKAVKAAPLHQVGKKILALFKGYEEKGKKNPLWRKHSFPQSIREGLLSASNYRDGGLPFVSFTTSHDYYDFGKLMQKIGLGEQVGKGQVINGEGFEPGQMRPGEGIKLGFKPDLIYNVKRIVISGQHFLVDSSLATKNKVAIISLTPVPAPTGDLINDRYTAEKPIAKIYLGEKNHEPSFVLSRFPKHNEALKKLIGHLFSTKYFKLHVAKELQIPAT